MKIQLNQVSQEYNGAICALVEVEKEFEETVFAKVDIADQEMHQGEISFLDFGKNKIENPEFLTEEVIEQIKDYAINNFHWFL